MRRNRAPYRGVYVCVCVCREWESGCFRHVITDERVIWKKELEANYSYEHFRKITQYQFQFGKKRNQFNSLVYSVK